MSSIPKDLYDHVFVLAQDLNEASEAGDRARYASRFADLQALYETRNAKGSPHPFLTEALADYTDDTDQSVALYFLSLQQAAALPGEITYSKHISLAEALISLGRVKEAREHLQIGQRQARQAGDAFWVNDAARISRTLVA